MICWHAYFPLTVPSRLLNRKEIKMVEPIMRTAEQYSPTEATGFSGFAGPILDRL